MCGGDPWNMIYFNTIYMYYACVKNNENNTPAEFHMHKHTINSNLRSSTVSPHRS